VAQEEIDKAMHAKGMPFSVGDLKPEQIDDLLEALKEMTVDVDAPDATVRVFCE
jgi:hypothetical protein